MASLRKGRAQTVLEFMMTYGWAILILVILLAVLFYLGVLNPRGSVSNTCLFSPGYSCYTFKMANGSGALFLDLGQATGRSILITRLSCSANESVTPQPLSSNITVPSGEHRWITAGDSGNYYNCTDAQGNNLTATSAPAGERYKGKLCIGYVEPATGTTRTVCGDITAMFDPTVGGAGGGGTPTPTPTPVLVLSCFNITSPGTYILGGNISASGTCINMTSGSSGAALDCQGYTITGSYGGTYGVYVYRVNGVTIRNCALHHFSTGIYLGWSNFSSLISNNAYDNCQGIAMQYSSNNTIDHNTANFNLCPSFTGFYIVQYSDNNTFTNNTANSNGYGMYISTISNTIANNNFSSNSQYGITVQSSGTNTFANNRFCANAAGNISCSVSQTDGGGNICAPVGTNSTCSSSITCSGC